MITPIGPAVPNPPPAEGGDSDPIANIVDQYNQELHDWVVANQGSEDFQSEFEKKAGDLNTDLGNDINAYASKMKNTGDIWNKINEEQPWQQFQNYASTLRNQVIYVTPSTPVNPPSDHTKANKIAMQGICDSEQDTIDELNQQIEGLTTLAESPQGSASLLQSIQSLKLPSSQTMPTSTTDQYESELSVMQQEDEQFVQDVKSIQDEINDTIGPNVFSEISSDNNTQLSNLLTKLGQNTSLIVNNKNGTVSLAPNVTTNTQLTTALNAMNSALSTLKKSITSQQALTYSPDNSTDNISSLQNLNTSFQNSLATATTAYSTLQTQIAAAKPTPSQDNQDQMEQIYDSEQEAMANLTPQMTDLETLADALSTDALGSSLKSALDNLKAQMPTPQTMPSTFTDQDLASMQSADATFQQTVQNITDHITEDLGPVALKRMSDANLNQLFTQLPNAQLAQAGIAVMLSPSPLSISLQITNPTLQKNSSITKTVSSLNTQLSSLVQTLQSQQNLTTYSLENLQQMSSLNTSFADDLGTLSSTFSTLETQINALPAPPAPLPNQTQMNQISYSESDTLRNLTDQLGGLSLLANNLSNSTSLEESIQDLQNQLPTAQTVTSTSTLAGMQANDTQFTSQISQLQTQISALGSQIMSQAFSVHNAAFDKIMTQSVPIPGIGFNFVSNSENMPTGVEIAINDPNLQGNAQVESAVSSLSTQMNQFLQSLDSEQSISRQTYSTDLTDPLNQLLPLTISFPNRLKVVQDGLSALQTAVAGAKVIGTDQTEVQSAVNQIQATLTQETSAYQTANSSYQKAQTAYQAAVTQLGNNPTSQEQASLNTAQKALKTASNYLTQINGYLTSLKATLQTANTALQQFQSPTMDSATADSAVASATSALDTSTTTKNSIDSAITSFQQSITNANVAIQGASGVTPVDDSVLKQANYSMIYWNSDYQVVTDPSEATYAIPLSYISSAGGGNVVTQTSSEAISYAMTNAYNSTPPDTKLLTQLGNFLLLCVNEKVISVPSNFNASGNPTGTGGMETPGLAPWAIDVGTPTQSSDGKVLPNLTSADTKAGSYGWATWNAHPDEQGQSTDASDGTMNIADILIKMITPKSQGGLGLGNSTLSVVNLPGTSGASVSTDLQTFTNQFITAFAACDIGLMNPSYNPEESGDPTNPDLKLYLGADNFGTPIGPGYMRLDCLADIYNYMTQPTYQTYLNTGGGLANYKQDVQTTLQNLLGTTGNYQNFKQEIISNYGLTLDKYGNITDSTYIDGLTASSPADNLKAAVGNTLDFIRTNVQTSNGSIPNNPFGWTSPEGKVTGDDSIRFLWAANYLNESNDPFDLKSTLTPMVQNFIGWIKDNCTGWGTPQMSFSTTPSDGKVQIVAGPTLLGPLSVALQTLQKQNALPSGINATDVTDITNAFNTGLNSVLSEQMNPQNTLPANPDGSLPTSNIDPTTGEPYVNPATGKPYEPFEAWQTAYFPTNVGLLSRGMLNSMTQS